MLGIQTLKATQASEALSLCPESLHRTGECEGHHWGGAGTGQDYWGSVASSVNDGEVDRLSLAALLQSMERSGLLAVWPGPWAACWDPSTEKQPLLWAVDSKSSTPMCLSILQPSTHRASCIPKAGMGRTSRTAGGGYRDSSVV